MTSRNIKQQRTVQSLSRSLSMLESIADKADGIALAAICRQSGLHRSTAHHLLKTLALHGYVAQDEQTRDYRLGPKVYQLASAKWSESQIAQLALPYLQDLVRRTGETVNLAMRKDSEAVLLETVDGEGTLRVVDRVGAARPIYASAVGKILLAWTPEDEREVLIEALHLKPIGPRTITDRGKLRKELTRIRELGYALDDEEMERGVRCVAAPVFVLPGRAAAAIGIAGPAARMTRETLFRFSKPLIRAVRQLSERLSRPGM
jgi:IclR family transcriptional regulator, KDG regulon repressor